MLHFGIEELGYLVKFDSSCYYPISFNSERRHTKILFGASFGFWWWNNSISISRRPSQHKLDKIDLFVCTYSNGFKKEEYAGSIDIEKQYDIKLIFQKQDNIYRIRAYEANQRKPVFNICNHYEYPLSPIGYTIKRTHGNKIFIQNR